MVQVYFIIPDWIPVNFFCHPEVALILQNDNKKIYSKKKREQNVLGKNYWIQYVTIKISIILVKVEEMTELSQEMEKS